MSEERASEVTPLVYEKGSAIRGTKDRFRLTLREKDQEFFQTFVQKEDGFANLIQISQELSDSQRNIRANAVLFKERLDAMSEGERLQLAQFTVTRCYLVVVATPDLDSAYRIFSVLNSRGLDLSATDILKAEIIGSVGALQRDAYTKKWEDVEEDLGRDAFGDLFSHIRMVYRKAKPKGTLIKEFKDHVKELSQPVHFIDGVLMPMAKAFEEIIDADYQNTPNAEGVNEYLKCLNRLEFKDWVPPALKFVSRHRQSPDKMLRFFGFGASCLCNACLEVGINEGIERFSRLTGDIDSAAVLGDKSTLQLSPSEKYLVYARLDGQLYETLAARARSAVLLRLDSLLSGGGAIYEYDTVTVEHVLPQYPKLGSKWLQWFPEVIDRVGWVHRVGNLALLTRKKNSAASNYDFDMKKQAYFAKKGISPFVLTTQVLGKDEWTPQVVAQRQADLLSVLEKHWRLEGRKSPLEEQLCG